MQAPIMSNIKKFLYSIAAGLATLLVALFALGGQPAEYRAFLATQQPPDKENAAKHYARARALGADADASLEQALK